MSKDVSPTLTGAQKSLLRSLAQTLEPKVFVGKAGVNPSIARLLELAFKNADLVKVRFTADRKNTKIQAEELAKLTASAIAGSVGKTVSFYRKGEVAE